VYYSGLHQRAREPLPAGQVAVSRRSRPRQRLRHHSGRARSGALPWHRPRGQNLAPWLV